MRDILEALWRAYREEERIWRQKSRVRWLKEGDRNKKYFHRVCKVRTVKKNITQLKYEGRLLTTPSEIKQAMRDHFQNFFRTSKVPRHWLQNLNPRKVTTAENQLLEAAFSIDEIWEVVKNFDGNRAPGPDGFSMDFFKKFWNLVKDDLLNIFNDFYHSGRIVKGLNSTFIALIPKGGQQEEISDYRPISLIGSVYKLLAKVLSVRLSLVLPGLLSQNQFAFTAGRQIADCSLIASEIVHSMSSRPEGGLLFKIDFAKAYDSVEWGFLLELLHEMGFGGRWIRWMQSCVSTASLAVLVNGSPSEFFTIQKGLRQGDPLSPLLFNIVANGMSCMLNQLLEGDIPCGVEVASRLRINHLQFADDSLFFTDCDQHEGLKVNFSKSAVYGVNALSSTVQEAASWWNFKVGSLPFMYLGAPLGGTRYGGLGVGFLEWKNKAMLLKWVWRFGREKDALWRMVICKKYGLPMELISLNLDTLELKKLSIPLMDVCTVWRDSGLVGSVFRDGLACQVGRGASVLFWLDHWTGSGPLRLVFPRVFALATHKRETIMECGTPVGHQWAWNITFQRDFLGWERQHYDAFMCHLQSLVPKQGENATVDCMVWKHDNMGLFSVKSLCAVVEARWFTEDGWSVPKFLRPILPSKIALFLWQVQKNRIATKENLVNRGVALEDGMTCVLCLLVTESVVHLFLHCPRVWQLWAAVLHRKGVWWSLPGSIHACLAEWSSIRRSTSKVLWELSPYAICWVIWMARNNVLFNEKPFDSEDAWEAHMFLLFSWIKAWWKECPYGADQFARGFTKIDVEGSSGCAGIGGVLRNSVGTVVGKFCRRVDVQRADEADVLAILYALLFCHQFQVFSVDIESDSTLAVGWVKGEKMRPWKLTNELNLIDYLMPVVSCNGVNHILREGNTEANELAKLGCLSVEPVWLFQGSTGYRRIGGCIKIGIFEVVVVVGVNIAAAVFAVGRLNIEKNSPCRFDALFAASCAILLTVFDFILVLYWRAVKFVFCGFVFYSSDDWNFRCCGDLYNFHPIWGSDISVVSNILIMFFGLTTYKSKIWLSSEYDLQFDQASLFSPLVQLIAHFSFNLEGWRVHFYIL
ncbi:uncharacterized protein LOC130742662 [Lotus japonicus]|uniref:uncharacterized protein LOC130742662 n=1 Tax=Lotus japonicus TaxID=34305 RepID=UPI002582B26F|nr:uncharacterized protein LOC130742662 [Lotus japonicus]